MNQTEPTSRKTARVAVAITSAIALGCGGALTVAATPASAATIGNVYISFPTWQANCPNGGSVKTIWADDGWQSWNGDAGDDLIYGKVALNQWNTVRYEVFCYKWPAGYYQAGTQTSFYPTRNGQTIWVGPGGWSRN